MAKATDRWHAKRMTDAYEYSDRNECRAMLSDLKNNQIGLELSDSASCEDACYQANLDILLMKGRCK